MSILPLNPLPQPRQPAGVPLRVVGVLLAVLALFSLLGSSTAIAEEQTSSGSSPAATDATWARESPLGPIEYRAGQGLRVGRTGLNIGGFTTLEGERLEHEGETFAIDGISFLLLFEPVHYFRVFSELELADLFEVDGGGDTNSDPNLDIDRLYGEVSASDYLNLRLGQSLTPVGLWNPVLAEPVLWTTSDPLITEFAFDEVVNGAMLRGSVFPASGDLTYKIYGQFFDAIDPPSDPDIEASDHGTGFYLDYTGEGGNWATGTSFLASERDGRWSYLGGLDAEWYAGSLEITAEILFSGGDRKDRRLWGTYVQGVYGVLPWFYVVGRYEYFDPAEGKPEVHLFDVGFAWTPRSYLLLKADYLFADRSSDVVAPGFRGSLSLLF